MPARPSCLASGWCWALGWATLAEALEDVTSIPFADLPGWPQASAPGHAGRLLLGTLDGVPVVCLQGRLHLYEGHSARQVVEPVLLMGRLGRRAWCSPTRLVASMPRAGRAR